MTWTYRPVRERLASSCEPVACWPLLPELRPASKGVCQRLQAKHAVGAFGSYQCSSVVTRPTPLQRRAAPYRAIIAPGAPPRSAGPEVPARKCRPGSVGPGVSASRPTPLRTASNFANGPGIPAAKPSAYMGTAWSVPQFRAVPQVHAWRRVRGPRRPKRLSKRTDNLAMRTSACCGVALGL